MPNLHDPATHRFLLHALREAGVIVLGFVIASNVIFHVPYLRHLAHALGGVVCR